MVAQTLLALKEDVFGIYIIGANDVYKTTWCLDLERAYGLPLITEAPGLVISRHNTDFATVRKNCQKLAQVQREIFELQVKSEKAQTGPYFSDGAWNNIAFFFEWGLEGADLFESEEFQDYLDIVRKGIIFFVRPHHAIVGKSGFQSQSGTKREAVYGIDYMLKGLLEQFRMRYLSVHAWKAQERMRTAEFVLGTPKEFKAALKARNKR